MLYDIMFLLCESYRFLFWLWPTLFVTQLLRALHSYPHRTEQKKKYYGAVLLAIIALIIMSTLPYALVVTRWYLIIYCDLICQNAPQLIWLRGVLTSRRNCNSDRLAHLREIKSCEDTICAFATFYDFLFETIKIVQMAMVIQMINVQNWISLTIKSSPKNG